MTSDSLLMLCARVWRTLIRLAGARHPLPEGEGLRDDAVTLADSGGARRVSGCWAVVVAALLPAAGCAAGAWLESPLEENLPIDPHRNGYPTAVRASLADDDEPEPGPPVAAKVSEPARQRPNPNEPLLTPLAVVPPQLVRLQPSAPPTPPPAVPMAASELVELSNKPAWLESAAAPIPQEMLTRWPGSPWQPPQAAAASLPAAAPAIPIPNTASAESTAPNQSALTQKVEKAAHEEPDSPGERLASIDRARQELMRALENEIRERRAQSTSDEELPRLEQQLRLAYLESGRLDEAVSVIESLDPQQREAYKNLMFGLGVWLSPDEARRAPLRSAKVARSLRDATNDLAAASKLEVRN